MPLLIVNDGIERVEDVGNARAKIDEEIARLEAQLVQLRVRRNMLAPILLLPADVLWQIMTYLPKNHYESWIPFTQASHHLRALALQHPLLWNCISLPSTPTVWVERLIARSRSTPLAITLNYSAFNPTYWKRVTPLLVGELGRVTSLVCHDPKDVIGSGTWSQESPLDFSISPLKRLEVHKGERLYRRWKPKQSLQSLHIDDGCFNPALISPGLSTLVLKKLDPDTLPPAPEFCGLMSSLTNLRHLTLERVLSTLSFEKDSDPEALDISLPSLNSLEVLQEPEEKCTRFLSCASFPRLAKLNVSIDSSVTSLSPLRKALSEVWCKTSIFDPTNLSPGGLELQVAMPDDGNCFGVDLYSGNGHVLGLRWRPRRAANAETKPPFVVLSTLPLSRYQLQTLRLQGKHIRPTDIASVAASTSPGPQKLHLWGPACDHLLHSSPLCDCASTRGQRAPSRSTAPGLALAAAQTDLDSDSGPCASCQQFTASFFPRLQTLVLNTEFLFWVKPQGLKEFLAHRRSCGQPLRKIEIHCLQSDMNVKDSEEFLEIEGVEVLFS